MKLNETFEELCTTPLVGVGAKDAIIANVGMKDSIEIVNID